MYTGHPTLIVIDEASPMIVPMPKGQLDPITMKPDQLIFAHWNLTEQYSNVLETMRDLSYQGADVTQMNELNHKLDHIEDDMKLSEMFLKISGFTDMEIYN